MAEPVFSYVDLTYQELEMTWRNSNAVQGSDYTENELRSIHRKWRSLGKRIAAGRRIPDGPLGGGNKRRRSA